MGNVLLFKISEVITNVSKNLKCINCFGEHYLDKICTGSLTYSQAFTVTCESMGPLFFLLV